MPRYAIAPLDEDKSCKLRQIFSAFHSLATNCKAQEVGNSTLQGECIVTRLKAPESA